MARPFIFVSCGQFSEAEKSLGKEIVKLVKTLTGLDAFFAEDVQDLSGLDANILEHLRNCAAFITVMHPRGKIVRPDKSEHVRASVWIEQEIAIATYIQRTELRKLPVMAFIHTSVGREGIRDLLHLNPTYFIDKSEVLAELRERLPKWRTLDAASLHVQLRAGRVTNKDGHPVRRLEVFLVNDTTMAVAKLNARLILPAGILNHWSATYPTEVKSDDPRYRQFRFSENHCGPVPPRDTRLLISLDYCATCAQTGSTGIATLLGQDPVTATVWIGGTEYSDQKTIGKLAEDADARSR